MGNFLRAKVSTQELEDLTNVLHLLHLAHHRNKNQHRRAHWYRHLLLLRKHTNRLVTYYSDLHHVPDTHAARHRKLAQDKVATLKIYAELEYLSDVLVPRCIRAFSQLVTDLRFAVLGVALVAMLSQICGILGITAHLEDKAERDVTEVLKKFEREEWGAESDRQPRTSKSSKSYGSTGSHAFDEDVGEVVTRVDPQSVSLPPTLPAHVDSEDDDVAARKKTVKPLDPGQRDGKVVDEEAVSTSKKYKLKDPIKSKKAKKKKKGGDAIDDLFAGL